MTLMSLGHILIVCGVITVNRCKNCGKSVINPPPLGNRGYYS